MDSPGLLLYSTMLCVGRAWGRGELSLALVFNCALCGESLGTWQALPLQVFLTMSGCTVITHGLALMERDVVY